MSDNEEMTKKLRSSFKPSKDELINKNLKLLQDRREEVLKVTRNNMEMTIS